MVDLVNELDGKVAIVTGSARNIGRATVEELARAGASVVVNAVQAKELCEEVAEGINAAGGKAIPVMADITDPASVRDAVAQAIASEGRIDVVFNNAGYGLHGPIEGASEEQMRHQFEVNLFGVVRVMNAVLPHMRTRRQGLILTTSSIGGLIGMPFAPFYIASKHAVEGLIEPARFELRPFGVRLELVEPGGIRTDFVRRSAEWTHHPDYADQIATARSMAITLLDNAPDPAEVARVVHRAATDRSERLRYLAKPGPYVTLNRMLPDALWRRMIQTALSRASRADGLPAKTDASTQK